jgi:hypothetical protein
MNESDDLQNDPLLDEVFSQLRRIELPSEAKILNRQVVMDELAHLQATGQNLVAPWWRRTIMVPVPLAVCLTVAAGLMLFWILFENLVAPAVQFVAPHQPDQQSAHMPSTSAVVTTPAVNTRPVVEYYETETYLCGIGRLKSESGYLIQEENQ